jgi:putative glutamine amidotransferase
MQLINVHHGGALHQDISGFYAENQQISSIWPRKEVLIDSDSQLSEILGKEECIVNALHNQAVKDPAPDVRIVAQEAETQITQGIELTNHEFVIGVQWHPEYMPQVASQRRLFRAFVHQCKQAPNYT